jgi:DNA-binding transcriptional regulator YbjK
MDNKEDRKTVIADAAIALLAAAGAKGLTHRAVDAQAGLPAGSTSFYCRTRHELLTLALLRHAALDMADLQSDAQRQAQPGWGLNAFVDLLTYRVTDWLSPAKRARLVARFELFMIASHEPELAAIVSQQRQHFLHATEAALRQAGVPQAKTLAPMLLVLVDALLLDHVRAGAPILSTDQHKALFQQLLGQEAGQV